VVLVENLDAKGKSTPKDSTSVSVSKRNKDGLIKLTGKVVGGQFQGDIDEMPNADATKQTKTVTTTIYFLDQVFTKQVEVEVSSKKDKTAKAKKKKK
jgi:hypothetical protein